MSTYLYLQCIDHDPPISSNGEVGQHLSDLPAVIKLIANREALLKAHELECDPADRWALTAVYFFAQHPKCHIRIVDEYDKQHPHS